MKRTTICLISLLLAINVAKALNVNHLRIESLENPIGIEYESPRFSWWLGSKEADVAQVSYQIQIKVGGKEVFNSGKVKSDQNNLVETKFKTSPKTRYIWQVRVWDNKGNSAKSEPTHFETGLFDNWNAKWISAPWDEEPKAINPVQYYRHEFKLKDEVKTVRVYATSYGIYEIKLNGKKVGDRELTPGWTSYETRLKYQTHVADALLNEGANCVSVRLAQGWVQGRIGLRAKPEKWQEKLAALIEIHVEYRNGKQEIILSNEKWKAATGGLIEGDIYDGEVFIDSLEPNGWQNVGFEDKNWEFAKTLDLGYNNILADHIPGIKVIEELKFEKRDDVDFDEMIYDFGQNITGRVQITIVIKEPCKVLIEHGEVLDKFGRVYTDNLRKAKARLLLAFSKPGIYRYTPAFTFMGFRYARVKGLTRFQVKKIKAQVLSTDLERTGYFDCSNEKINKLYANNMWSQKGNFLDVPMDCPQRDERMGWTGDAQVYARTASYNSSVAAFFRDWLYDLKADQYENGAVPWIVPDVFKFEKKPSAGWADAALIIPWAMYQQYGDEKFLKDQYTSMKAWVDYMIDNAEEYIWLGDAHFGDWMNLMAPARPGSMNTTPETDYLAQAFFQHSLKILTATSKILNHEEDYKFYSNYYTEANSAFLKEFVAENGRISPGTQTSYILALQFDLLPENLRQSAIERLANSIKEYGHLTTGFLGTPHICPTLSDVGRSDLAYDLLLREEFPSWLYQINNGATTMWERWDGITTQGNFQDPYVNSFNHYAYGAVIYWMYAHMCGIKLQMEDGRQTITIKPEIDGRIAFANASYLCNQGEINSYWKLEREKLIFNYVIPANATATVIIPEGFYLVSHVSISNDKEIPINYLISPSRIQSGSGAHRLVLKRLSDN